MAVEDVRPVDNRRRVRRARTLLAGKIVIAQGLNILDCMIRDFSSGGARVRINAATPLPPKVSLLVIKEGLLFEANVAWRQGDETGVTFVGQYDLRGDVDPARKGIRALWAQLTSSR
ncbi:MAG TPA: PilZ domain-containing protein [Caulobacteraceae bacterium]|nr:PilZ domain-containing protein [Caulobacteraceae bacterium]